MKKKLILFYFCLLLLFFSWGVFTERNKIFPYKTLDLLKEKTYDKFLKVNVKDNLGYPILKEYHKKYPNFLDKKINKINLTKYYKKSNIWTDRVYYNHENDGRLLNFYLIQIKRHRTQKINIELQEDIIIYRPICELNNNSNYDDWERVDFEIAIVGTSCVHNKIVKKKFKKGAIYLNSGGPVSSDPIFIQKLLNVDSIIIK